MCWARLRPLAKRGNQVGGVGPGALGGGWWRPQEGWMGERRGEGAARVRGVCGSCTSSGRWLVTSPRGTDGRTARGSFHWGPWLEPRVTHDWAERQRMRDWPVITLIRFQEGTPCSTSSAWLTWRTAMPDALTRTRIRSRFLAMGNLH